MFAIDALSQAPISALATFPTLYPVGVDETCTVSDPFTAQADFAGEEVDFVSLTDEGPGTYNFFGYVTDGIDLNQLDDVIFDANTIVSESLTVPPEDIGSAFAFNRQVNETTTLTTQEFGNIDYNDPAVTESATITDAETGYRGQFPAVAETATLTDTRSSQADFSSATTETLTTTDTRSSRVDFGSVVTETTTLTEQIPESGWQTIDDRDSVVWVPINNSQ